MGNICMQVYQCNKCSEPIRKRDTKFCTSCGKKVSNPIPAQYLIDGKKESWNIKLIGFWVVWVLGGAALLFNAQNDNVFAVIVGVVGLVFGGVYISKSGSIKETKNILIDSRKIRCSNDF
jgi:rRNA maturation protein Nop10